MESDNGNGTSVQSSGPNIFKHINTFSLVIYCAIILVGTIGNGLVIYVTGYKMKKTVNSVWFLNLALADFLFTAFLIFTAVSLYQDHHWPFGNFMCKLNSFVSVVNMFASVFFLTFISLDRCLSIWVVVWAQNKRTIFKAQVMSAVIWLAAGICSAPSAFLRTVKEQGNNTSCYYNITDKQRTILYTFRFSLGFLIPFLVILFSYVAIGIRARRLQRTSKRRSRRIIFAIIFAFFICWFPFHVLSFIELKRLDSLVSLVQFGGPLTVCLAFMNSCLNPILYVFMCDEFQKKLKQSIWLVLENALAEDHLSYVGSSRSLSSWIPRKSVSTTPTGEDDAKTSMNLMEEKNGPTQGVQGAQRNQPQND